MNLPTLFNQFNLTKVRLNVAGVGVEIEFNQDDQDAAWELYVEMLTRIVTQPLPANVGDEQTALDSVYSLFGTTREILHRRGRNSIQFSKVAIPVLNQVVRPFTAKWHRESLAGAFGEPARCGEFRQELITLQADLRNYNRLLASIAGVEDLTDLEPLAGIDSGSN
jgi:hypothetical protein